MKKVLIVDDEEDILILLKSRLTLKGYLVRTATSCDEGLDIFYDFKPDIVFLDVNVGNADGRIMCKTIKAHADYKHIPVILISANSELLIPYAEYEATAVIEKPFNIPHLLSVLQSYPDSSQ